MEDIILGALRNLEGSFKDNELAYLALTSKVENPLRDRIAYNIFNEFEKDPKKDYLVCREWKGESKGKGNRHPTDLAILKNSKTPLALIEFKAHSVPGYSTNEYGRHMEKDLKFLKLKAEKETELYYIFLTTIHDGREELKPKIGPSVKYFDKINRSIKNKYNLESKIHGTWKCHLKNNKMQNKSNEPVKISGGEYHGHKISVIAQVLGPLYKRDLANF